MIDIAQDGVRSGGQWLKPLVVEREMQLAVYAASHRADGQQVEPGREESESSGQAVGEQQAGAGRRYGAQQLEPAEIVGVREQSASRASKRWTDH